MQREEFIKSEFHTYRENYGLKVPKILNAKTVKPKMQPVSVLKEIADLFKELTKTQPEAMTFEEVESEDNLLHAPLRVGCVLSGGQASGGHNVIVGIYDYIKRVNKNSQLFGFLKGPIGIIKGDYIELTEDIISFYKNRGGFDMIQSGRDKIEKDKDFESSAKNCNTLKLDGLVIIGGDDSNTNACVLADYFLKTGCPTRVVGCPKTIDGDLKNEFIEVSFGFDTACKTYSELIGNLMMDTFSSKFYYHFVRVMGRSASHIALECALLTRPNFCLIGEEIQKKGSTVKELVDQIVKMIEARHANNKDYGVILVPEGVIEFIPEFNVLISEVNRMFGKEGLLSKRKFSTMESPYEEVYKNLSPKSQEMIAALPRGIADQLLLDRDGHGNVKVAQIETEKFLISIVEDELAKRKFEGRFKANSHYFGYEGRCAFPTNFDSNYCYCLGLNAGLLIEKGQTGVMSVIRNLEDVPDNWIPGGYPLVTMMNVECKLGKNIPVIKKYLTDLNGPLFKLFAQEREKWMVEDYYRPTGPVQFEFFCQRPFLVQPPTIEHFYDQTIKTYNPHNMPYQILDPRYHFSALGLQRLDAQIQLPQIIRDENFKVVKQQTLEFKDPKTKLKAMEQYAFLGNDCNNLVEVLKSVGELADQSQVLGKSKNLKFGIFFNGRQAPGQNNIIEGLLKFVEQNEGDLYGFIDGINGVLEQKYIKITKGLIQYYRNQGGVPLIGRSIDFLRIPKELETIAATCNKLELDGLVIGGGAHSMTGVLILSNYLKGKNSKTKVIGVPCTIGANVQHHMLESCVGFDTASKTYSQIIGNLMIDSASAVKYWYFIRLMGRDPSHMTLECALQTHPNITLLSEEILQKGWNLKDIVKYVTDIVMERGSKKKLFGTCLIPEGLLSALPEFSQVMEDLNNFFKKFPDEKSRIDAAVQLVKNKNNYVSQNLSAWTAARFNSLPLYTKQQLVHSREETGFVNISAIQTERLIADLVKEEIEARQNKLAADKIPYTPIIFSPICFFLGYQGRSQFPTNFDCELGLTYGYLAGAFVEAGLTAYCVTARGLNESVDHWQLGGIPILNMCQIKAKSEFGENQVIVPSSDIDLNAPPFLTFRAQKDVWKLSDYYQNPGPIQFLGPKANDRCKSLKLEHANYITQIKTIENLTQSLNAACRFGTHEDLLKITIDHLKNLEETLKLIKPKYQ